MYWGITSLILIIGVVGVYFMLQPESEHENRYKVKQLTKNTQLTTAVANSVDSAGGDVHVDDSRKSDSTLPDSATTTGGDTAVPQLSEVEVERLLAKNRAQQAKFRADYIAEWGEPPPPDASWQHYRDNHGDVHRHYRGTVAICDYDYVTKFAPTPAELERYKQLRAALKKATLADKGGSWENPSPEAQWLDTEIKSLHKSAQREIPFPSGFRYFGRNNSGIPSPTEQKRLDAIALHEFYQRFDMEHLYELHEESTKFYQKY